jgi:hypothetical protein
MSTSSSENKTFDASRRRLCPDGACIGLLDETGRCKECGLTAGGQRTPGVTAPAPLPDDDDDQLEPEALAAEPQEASGGFDPKRRLCPDGACVGVLGADGRCSVCGRAAEEG